MNRHWAHDARKLWDKTGSWSNGTSHANNTSPAFRFHNDMTIWLNWTADGTATIDLRLEGLKPGVAVADAVAGDWNFFKASGAGTNSAIDVWGFTSQSSNTGAVLTLTSNLGVPFACSWARFHLNFGADPTTDAHRIEIYAYVPSDMKAT